MMVGRDVVGRDFRDKRKIMSFNKVTKNFGVGIRGIEKICIERSPVTMGY